MRTSSSKTTAQRASSLAALRASLLRRRHGASRSPRLSGPTPPPPPPPPAVPNGAIFQAANGYAPLTSGQRAAQVGDVITIVLVERTQGTSKSNGARPIATAASA